MKRLALALFAVWFVWITLHIASQVYGFDRSTQLASCYMADSQPDGRRGTFSGVLIAKQGRTYYGLTAAHCYNPQARATIHPPEKQRAEPIQWIGQLNKGNSDLALFKFDSQYDLPVVKIAETNAPRGTRFWSSNYPGARYEQYPRQGQVISAELLGMTTSGPWAQGESGGGVFNERNELIGIVSAVAMDRSHGVSTNVEGIRYFLTQYGFS